jgi:phenylalanyl-tRNA synthetase beta chain
LLNSLGFGIVKEGSDELWVDVPFSKPDITLPADVVEEIMRIDGLDNIEIPETISISPAVEKNQEKYVQKEKLANYLTGLGFHEIFTNSISNSKFYSENVLQTAVKMINSLSNELNIMRPQMLQGGLQVVAHNNNRKNYNLRLFEFGKTYSTGPDNNYTETNHLSFYSSGNITEQDWSTKAVKSDYFYLKGVVENSLSILGITRAIFEPANVNGFQNYTEVKINNKAIAFLGEVDEATMKQFDLKVPVFYADILWDELLTLAKEKQIQYREVSKFPAVERDLSIVVDKNIPYAQIKKLASSAGIEVLKSTQLFDIFESEKLGAGKKAMAVSFTFLDETKTLTDKEIDAFMQQIIAVYEKEIAAEIRK